MCGLIGSPLRISTLICVLIQSLGPMKENARKAGVLVALGPFPKTSRVSYFILLFYFETVRICS